MCSHSKIPVTPVDTLITSTLHTDAVVIFLSYSIVPLPNAMVVVPASLMQLLQTRVKFQVCFGVISKAIIINQRERLKVEGIAQLLLSFVSFHSSLRAAPAVVSPDVYEI
ncbi:hypothetical protein FPQ18DRAFT_303486 [Pyronema domesticum]|nr:hypothetical protein FPQ18DRAFT_303486 [Pyronema domesticum]